jgi:hypothetical protein
MKFQQYRAAESSQRSLNYLAMMPMSRPSNCMIAEQMNGGNSKTGWRTLAGDRHHADAALLVFGFDDRDLAGGDFTQSRDDFLVVRFDQWPGALEQLLGAACRSQYQFESIRDVFETIFYSYSSHRALILLPGLAIVNAGWIDDLPPPASKEGTGGSRTQNSYFSGH